MAVDAIVEKKPLWLAIEEKISEASSQGFSEANKEQIIQTIAESLDSSDYNVSNHGRNMLDLRWAIDACIKVGKPFMKDFDTAISVLTLETIADTKKVTSKIINDLGALWPALKSADRKPDVFSIITTTKLDLLIAQAKKLSGDLGIRYLIESNVSSEVIVRALAITEDTFKTVNAAVEAERAEKIRVKTLILEKEHGTDQDKVKHCILNSVSEALIIEIAGVSQEIINEVNKAMEEELQEKKRLEEEEAAKKAAAAEGPPLEDIPADEMLEFIETIRDILDICTKEDEIRGMCAQSSIPKSLVDVAVSDPDKLDELESQAEG